MGAEVTPVYTIDTSTWPQREPLSPSHWIVGLLAVGLHILTLSTPHKASWVLVRRCLLFPTVVVLYLWALWVPIWPVRIDQWGVGCLLFVFIMRAIDHACYVPETHIFRLRPSPTYFTENQSPNLVNPPLIREPVPPPFSFAKVCWALSLFSSWRGIGWNFVCPLSLASQQHPYLRTSTRKAFLAVQIRTGLLILLVSDATRTFIKFSAYHFFSGQTAYAALTLAQKISYSLAVVARVWLQLSQSWIVLCIACVSFGGLMGWEGEFWSPWGWPPVLGGVKEIWEYPGLSTLWSRTWNGHNRRWLIALGWVGIGERILRLPVSGPSAHPQTVPSVKQASTPGPSHSHAGMTERSERPERPRPVSPSDPVPTTPAARPMSPKIALANLIKSVIVFTLCGLMHDAPAWLFATHGDSTGTIRLSYSSLIYTTPFFAVQPFALAAEALIKRQYRRAKVQAGIAKGAESGRLIFVERLVGFVLVWYWIGWTSGWYVSGVGRMRLYMWDEDEAPTWSLVGGLCYGRWWH